ncbi:MAG: hypothetical protein ACTMIA_17170 [Vibrio sp.]
MNHDHDYPFSASPKYSLRSFWSMSALLIGFTFFSATIWAGGKIGTAFHFDQILFIIIAGNLILSSYAATLVYIAYKTGCNTVQLGRCYLGEQGSKLSDVILGCTQVSGYAWGIATIAIALVKLLQLPHSWIIPLMIIFGLGCCITASMGIKVMKLLSKFSVPIMLVFIGSACAYYSLWLPPVIGMVTAFLSHALLLKLIKQEPPIKLGGSY